MDAMLSEITYEEFVEWQAFRFLDPPLGERADWLAAMLGVAFTSPYVKKGGRRPQIKDFLATWGAEFSEPVRKSSKQINEAMRKFVAMTKAAYGGKPNG